MPDPGTSPAEPQASVPSPSENAAHASLLLEANFATRFARGDLRNRQVMHLRKLLARLGPDLAPTAFTELLEDLLHWLRSTRKIPEMRPDEAPQTARLRMFLDALEHLPDQAAWLRAGVARVFTRCRAISLFTDVGLPSRLGFVSEMFERTTRAFLPDPPVEGDLGALLTRLFESERAVEWFEQLNPELGARLLALFALPEGKALEPLVRDLGEAAILLALRASNNGLASDVRARTPPTPLKESPFFRLPEAVRTAVFAPKTGTGPQANAAAPGASPAEKGAPASAREIIAACRKATRDVEASLEHTGVSVDLVYRLELIRRQLDRLYALLALVAPSGGSPVEGAGMRLVRTLLRGAYRDRSIRDLLRSSTRLLARRVVDAAAHSGEHYVTRTPAEFHALLNSAAGGGLVTAFTALFKFLIGWGRMAPFWEGFFFSTNYALSFVAMQLMGFTLASKQPSMTAAHLARAIGDGQDLEPQLVKLSEEVARTVRSQLAATVGNLAVVVPVAMAMDLALRLSMGAGLLQMPYADAVIASLHPFQTGVVPGAMVTGVALWFASLAGGTLENWAVYRRLPEALATHRRLRATVGPDRARRVSEWLMRHIAGFGGNLALGLQMGLVPTFAEFLGLPLQLPHVAVATGQLAFAGMSRGAHGVLHGDFAWACLGIVLVGTMNFGISFALALWVALRARESGPVAAFRVLRAVLGHFFRHPADFFRPPRTA